MFLYAGLGNILNTYLIYKCGANWCINLSKIPQGIDNKEKELARHIKFLLIALTKQL